MRKHASLVFLCTGILLVTLSGAYLWIQSRMADPAVAPTPRSIAGLSRTILDTGAQAALEIGQLHGKGFPLTVAAVAMYQGGATPSCGLPVRLSPGCLPV